jgi:hypothetical protein
MNLPVRLFLIWFKSCKLILISGCLGQDRNTICLAAAENGEIFWVEDLRISENFKLTPQTRRRFVWRWRHLTGG